jgi:hypothetical protein
MTTEANNMNMELLKSLRLFCWGILKRIYWIFGTLILDPFGWSQAFNIQYNPPRWSMWMLFAIGWVIAAILTYHELRLKTLKQGESNWIEIFVAK